MVVISIEELKENGAFEVEEFRECIESCRYYTINDYEGGKNGKWVDALDEVPSADVVEVVRCKDCKHIYKCACDGTAKNICDCMEIPVYEDFFCKWGEKNES